ncbi:retropepsin-like aspartic protease [Algibacillus agarilyticus]|uniref:retropepsin-like aspartic protease n=1 Tax=Algibacillus agarilyticus TaxID=2234133 RepID=UPI000DD01E14|nr:retropepsin-like aspartic protease [Algibacillus agarilyticus]
MTRILLLLLTISLALNIYWYQRFSSGDTHPAEKSIVVISSQPAGSSSPQAVVSHAIDTKPSLLLVNEAQQAFEMQDFYIAVDLLHDLEHEDEKQAQRLKYEWLKQLHLLIASQQYQQAHLFLDALLNFYPDDPMFKPVRAELFQKAGKIHDAITIYYDLLLTTQDDIQAATWRQFARDLSVHYIGQLKVRADWQHLLHFIDDVEQSDPDFTTYALARIQAYLALQQLDDADFELKKLAYDPSLSSVIAEFQQQLLLAQSERKAIQLQQFANQFFVSALINRADHVQLMIDTGAALTVISRDVFNRLSSEYEFTFVREAEMNTAGGLAMAQIYNANAFSIDEFEIKDLRIAVMPLSLSHHADGLLGMNFLRYFQFEIDQQNTQLWLKPNTPK